MDTYEAALKVLRELNPLVQAPEGARIAMVAAFLPPSDEYRRTLEWRALVELYRLEHVQSCDCALCRRFDVLVGKKTNPQELLPLEAA